jgi:hypothetical protein
MLLYAVNGDGIYCTVHCTVLYCTVLYCRPTVLYCMYCAVLCCTVLYCTVLYCTVQYSTLNIFTRIHTDKICAIHLDKGFMATRDGTCFAPGFWTGKEGKTVKRDFGSRDGKEGRDSVPISLPVFSQTSVATEKA